MRCNATKGSDVLLSLSAVNAEQFHVNESISFARKLHEVLLVTSTASQKR